MLFTFHLFLIAPPLKIYGPSLKVLIVFDKMLLG